MSDQKKFRITLWQLDTSTGWRSSSPKAIVYDAMDIGVEEYANDVGSSYWTLNNDNPQISKFTPLDTHYEIARWSVARSRWEFVAAGMLNDYSVTEYQTTFSGLDYMAVMNQIFTPLTNITFSNASPINPNLATVQKTTIFNSTDGAEGTDQVFGSSYDVNGKVIFDVVDTMTVSAASISAVATTTKTVSVSSGTSTYTASVETPFFQLTYSLEWTGSTTLSGGYTGSFGGLTWSSGFPSTPIMRVGIFAAPPASKDLGDPPVGSTGRIAEFNIPADSSSGVNRFKAQNRVVDILPLAAREQLYSALVSQGAASATVASALIETPTGSTNKTGTQTVYALRTGLTYSFALYAGIYAAYSTALNRWFSSNGTKSKTTQEATVGQGTDNISVIVSRVFGNAQTSKSDSRIRYSSLSISGSTQTTHITYSAGQPVVEYIGDVADIEMGSKTNNSKVIFGIDKPTGGATYSGNFKLQTSISSSATTAFALRYPENIKGFSFTPGLSRVRNDITVIPTEKYLTGATAQGSAGAQIIGATATDSASLALYGRLPMVAAQGGFINAEAAQNQANRLLNSYKPANSKQVGLSIVVDGVDLWNGWDVGESVRVTIKRGLVDIDEAFVISGVRWFGESAGHEKVELELVQGSAFGAQFSSPGGGTSATASRR